jgi:hypothetical protein
MLSFPDPSVKAYSNNETNSTNNVQSNNDSDNKPQIVTKQEKIDTHDKNLTKKIVKGNSEPIHPIFEEKTEIGTENAQPLVALLASIMCLFGASTGAAYNPSLAEAIQNSLQKNMERIKKNGLANESDGPNSSKPLHDKIDEHLKEKQKEEQNTKKA